MQDDYSKTEEHDKSGLNKGNPMRTGIKSAIRVMVSCIGFFIAVFIILFGITAIQGMSGQEQVLGLLFYFSICYMLGFGLGAACLAALRRKPKIWLHTYAFAIGGIGGGVFLALALKAMDQHEQQLRVITQGGPLGAFLLVGLVVSFIIPYFIGRAVLKVGVQ